MAEGVPFDTARFVAVYRTQLVIDTLAAPRSPIEEEMMLEVGRHASRFYSYTTYVADSVNQAALQRGSFQLQHPGYVTWEVYRNYPEKGSFQTTDLLGMQRIAWTSSTQAPVWQLLPDSAAQVAGFACSLAVATYKGRQWFAWYAPEIPLSEGPWMLGGLPGLILRTYDADRQYVFELTSLRQLKNALRPMLYKGQDSELMDYAAVQKLYKRYHADPIGFITGALLPAGAQTQVLVLSPDGQPSEAPKGQPYNPIER